MARGQQKLFSTLIDAADKPEAPRRRNFRQHDRDRLMAHRYYFYGSLERKGHEDALLAVADDLFLSESRVATILMAGETFELLRELTQEKPSAKELAKRYPQWSW